MGGKALGERDVRMSGQHQMAVKSVNATLGQGKKNNV